MLKVSFKCHTRGKLITFDCIAQNDSVAIAIATDWTDASGYSKPEMTLSRPYTPPSICNVVTHEYGPDNKPIPVHIGCCRA